MDENNNSMKPRVIMRIEVTPEAAKRLEETTDWFGMTHVNVHTRLIEWLADQPEIVQLTILGLCPESLKPDILTIVLKKMIQDTNGEAVR